MKRPRTVTLVAILLLSLPPIGLAAARRGPFTAPRRSVRSRDVDQRHLRLELKFNWERQEVRGRAIHTLIPFVPLQKIELDAAAMRVDRVGLVGGGHESNEEQLRFDSRGGKLTIRLDRRYRPDEAVRLAIDYRVTRPERGIHFVVPDRNEPDQARMVWTHSEPVDARRWFPCVDSPTDRFTSEVLVTVPEGLFVLSNGVLREKKDNPDGTRTWHWAQEQSHVSYLVSVVAGEFDAYEQQWDGIPVISYVPAGRLPDAARSFKKTPEMIAFFSRKIGYRYPWPKYAQICVDEYVAGGMEHTSATTLKLGTLHDQRAGLDVSSEGLVSHELAHQWWGNLLTCKDWAELWLNESFATYFATLWIEHDRGPDEAAWRRREEAESYFAEDKNRYRRPIVTYRYRQPGQMFDRHSYPKGARVLHMLRFVLDEEPFWRAIRHYCKKHAFDTVETADLRVAVEESTGQGLNWFFDQWVDHGGHPEYHVSHRWDEQRKTLRMTVKQTQKVDELTPLFRMPVDIELVTPGTTTRQRVWVAKREHTFHFPLDRRPRRVCFDPEDWILKKLTFEKSREEWLDQLRHDEHVICRFRAVRGLAKLAGENAVRDALAEAARGDKFWAVRQEAVRALGNFGGRAARDALLRAARQDCKSFVRREAIKTLAKFPHPKTRQALRRIIRHDRSYYAVAEALRALVQVDRAGCRPELLEAMQQESLQQVILKAAAEGLAELGCREVAEQFQTLLDGPCPPRRRAAVMNALARLGEGDPKVTEALGRHLDDARPWVRRAAGEALGKTGDRAAIDRLLARRRRETALSVLRTIDDSLDQLRGQQADLEEIRREIKALRRDNRRVSERLKKLEAAQAPAK